MATSYSIIVTHSGRLLDTLNGILNSTESVIKEDGTAQSLLKIGNWGIVKLKITMGDPITQIEINVLLRGQGGGAGNSVKRVDDSEGTEKWTSFIGEDLDKNHVFYIVTDGGTVSKIFDGGKDTKLVKDADTNRQIESVNNAISRDLRTTENNNKVGFLFVSDLVRTRETLQYLLESRISSSVIGPSVKDIHVLPCAHEISFPDGSNPLSVITGKMFQANKNIVAKKPKNPFKCHTEYNVNWGYYDSHYSEMSDDTPWRSDNKFISKEEYDGCNGPAMIMNAMKIIDRNNQPMMVKGNQKFQFTRHLLSCNNIGMGGDNAIKKKFGKDLEPGATVYGIFETIMYSLKNRTKETFNFNHVYVSNLYRTWITAVLLYGTQLYPEATLNLYVSPYLKEKGKNIGIRTITHGNFPDDIRITANKFLLFLNTMNYYFQDAEQNIPPKYRGIPPHGIPNDWYSQLPSTIILHLPPKQQTIDPQRITYKAIGENRKYVITHFCGIEDLIGPKGRKEFTNPGDKQLETFMRWFNKEKNYYPLMAKDGLVHVVAHSNIMQEYLRHFKIKVDKSGIPTDVPIVFDIDKIKEKGLANIRNSNSWRFTTTAQKVSEMKTYVSIDDATRDLELFPGVPMEKDIAKDLEKTYGDHTLCGIKIDPHVDVCTGLLGGGTRKRHKRATSKRKKRKHYKHKTNKRSRMKRN